MKLLWTLSFVAAMAFAQTPPHAELTADKVVHEGAAVHGLGHAKAKLGTLTILADEATLYSNTGELELRGHVLANFAAREDHAIFRHASGVLISVDPVTLHADAVRIKDGTLTAAGNIVIRTVEKHSEEDAQVQGDEMSMNLKTADATISGHTRTNNPPQDYSLPGKAKSFQFPPDIIKE